MEILLQDRQTGLFVRQDGEWIERSDGAMAFDTAGKAADFAKSFGWERQVRLVVRIERENDRILMPLLGMIAGEAAESRQRPARGSRLQLSPRS
jgi:hypothetical protein